MNNGYRFFKYGMGLVIICLLIIFAQYFIINANKEIIKDEINLSDTFNVDYRVHYVHNPYYNSEFIASGETYVSSLIDYIDIDFNYSLNYSKIIDATSIYDIKATTIAADSKTKDIVWDSYKKVLLADKKIKNNKANNVNIDESVRINYIEFNDFLIDYVDKNNIDVDAYISLKFIIKNKGIYENIGNINSNNSIELKIPLNKSNFKIEVLGENKSEKFKDKDDDGIKVIYLIIAGILWIIAVLLGSLLALSYRKYIINEGEYNRKLKKILNSHDNIIVNVEKLPSTRGLKVAEVTDFDELIDAWRGVRLPINLCVDKRRHKAKFILIKDDLAWTYTLKEDKKKKMHK